MARWGSDHQGIAPRARRSARLSPATKSYRLNGPRPGVRVRSIIARCAKSSSTSGPRRAARFTTAPPARQPRRTRPVARAWDVISRWSGREESTDLAGLLFGEPEVPVGPAGDASRVRWHGELGDRPRGVDATDGRRRRLGEPDVGIGADGDARG